MVGLGELEEGVNEELTGALDMVDEYRIGRNTGTKEVGLVAAVAAVGTERKMTFFVLPVSLEEFQYSPDALALVELVLKLAAAAVVVVVVVFAAVPYGSHTAWPVA